jgi:FKBP-type peptidyl-prolyl cis-trans isomerase 2
MEKPEEKETGKEVATPPQKRNVWPYAAVIFVAFIGGILIFLSASSITGFFAGGGEAREGDMVKVLYTGRLEDGTVFDTNIEEVARDAGLKKTFFQPLQFRLGAGQVIPGFDKAVEGMRPGQKKTVTIPPSEAYGEKNPARIIVSPRRSEFNRTETLPLVSEIPADQFLRIFGIKKPGDEFVLPGTELAYRLLNISGGFVSAKLLLEEGMVFRFPGSAWNTTVVSVNGNKAVLRHVPGETEIKTEFGRTSISYGEDVITVTVNPEEGQTITLPDQLRGGTISGKVVSVNEENFTVDFNNELAGKTLVFEIELLEIVK